MAQRTSVENNGLAGRIETDYNAAGKVTEMRTLSADGKLQQKVDYEYLPGFYSAQQTDTTYWPNGKTRKLTRHTYDESTNFTGESVEAFDESGKEIGGHKLTHNPWNGVYRCAEWSGAAQGYKEIDCPSGEEESGGGGKETRKVTYEEVVRTLKAARDTNKTAPQSQEQSKTTSREREVGLILPAGLRAGERVSGSMVGDPERYDLVPGISVYRITVPFDAARKTPDLSGWEIEISGQPAQAADGSITLIAPARLSEVPITFRAVDNPGKSVSKTLNLQLDAHKATAVKSFYAAALCLKGGLCEIKGPFSGDSRKTFASFEGMASTIVAESSDAAFLQVPELTPPGARMVFLEEGSKLAALPVAVGEIAVKDNGRELKAGETLVTPMTLEGPSDLPEEAWRGDSFDGASLELAKRLVPGFQISKYEHEADREDEGRKEGEPGAGGQILVVLKNGNPRQFSLSGSHDDALVFHLSEQAFERGEFRFNLLVKARSSGKIDVRAYAIPFLASMPAQEFTREEGQ